MAVASDGTVGSVTSTWAFASPWGFFPFSTWWFRFTGETGSATWTEATQAGADVSAPLLVAAGTRFMILWTTTNRVFYRLTAESQVQNFPAAVDTRSRARASCGETHCVVVYATRDANIEGFVFDHTRREPARFFVAAASTRIELEPQVAVITGSRALVTWRSLGPDGEKLVMRPMQLGPVKQRAVR